MESKEPCAELVVSVVPWLGTCATLCTDGGGGKTELNVMMVVGFYSLLLLWCHKVFCMELVGGDWCVGDEILDGPIGKILCKVL